jgi:multiple sugar transport system substrate-binding protein
LRLFHIASIAWLIGCGERPASTTAGAPSNTATRPSVTLRVLVVNDPALATAITRLRGEWTERAGGALAAEQKPWAEIASAEAIDADVIVFPARYLGDLVGRLRPVRDSVARGKMFDRQDLLPLVRSRLGIHDGRLWAFPIGVQVSLVGYRDAWLVSEGADPPSTWQDYMDLVSRVGDRPKIWPPRASVDHWSALMLLARAAAYACHPRQESPLFDPLTMEPRIASPPFVVALEEWRQEQATGQDAAADNSMLESRRWAELPGADRVFNQSTAQWEPMPSPRRVPMLSGGTLISVTNSSRNAASAFELASWLASSEIAPQLISANSPWLPCRRSNLITPNRWLAASAAGSPSKIASVLETALSRDDCLVVPQIPGVDEYLTELATSVDAALRGEQEPTDALQQAAAQWNRITDRRGRDAQRRAYLNHLGLVEP